MKDYHHEENSDIMLAQTSDDNTVDCDICDKNAAVCFCLECEKKLCDADFKVRFGVFSDINIYKHQP